MDFAARTWNVRIGNGFKDEVFDPMCDRARSLIKDGCEEHDAVFTAIGEFLMFNWDMLGAIQYVGMTSEAFEAISDEFAGMVYDEIRRAD